MPRLDVFAFTLSGLCARDVSACLCDSIVVPDVSRPLTCVCLLCRAGDADLGCSCSGCSNLVDDTCLVDGAPGGPQECRCDVTDAGDVACVKSK